MDGEDAAAARQDLLVHVRDVLKAVRVFKSQQPPQHTAVPAGTLGVLSVISHLEAENIARAGTTGHPGTAPGCHSKDLAARCALDPSTISRAVAALVRTGLVARTADPTDGRASRLVMTPRGREVLEDVMGWYDDLLAEALHDWSADDLNSLAALLERFAGDLMTHFGEGNRPTAPMHEAKTLEAAR
jgi:DNA-binding MarR family transcriptional regulator